MVSFLTPYASGAEMMRVHLASIRRFYPDAPILVSSRVGGGEADGYRRDFGARCWVEDCGYTSAYLRLLARCETPLACVLDHDVVLLDTLDPLMTEVASGRADLVGVEERIRLPEALAEAWPGSGGWLRFAPGAVASNVLLFDWRAFRRRWGLRGVLGGLVPGARHYDFDYGIGQRLSRHYYLRPHHVARYGLGNLLMDGGRAVAWHQWYGAHRTRLTGPATADRQRQIAAAGEAAFLHDYPALDLAGATPAWAPACDLDRERGASPPAADASALARTRRTAAFAARAVAARIVVAWERAGG
jgi:hypothetical protein